MEGARYLEDGKLTVFRRAGIYYARLRLAGSPKYITRSLTTSNEQTAVDLARRLLFQLEQRADQGLPPKSKTFAAVIDDYIRYRERDHRHGGTSAGMLRQIVRVSKFWREYVGQLAVEAIDDKLLREFVPWRRDYYANFEKLPKNAKLHPTDKTLQWDMMLGKAMVKLTILRPATALFALIGQGSDSQRSRARVWTATSQAVLSDIVVLKPAW
jgi:integrase